MKVAKTRLKYPETGIFVRAQNDSKWISADINHLDKESLLEFLKSRGGNNPLAEDCVGIILGHGNLHPMMEKYMINVGEGTVWLHNKTGNLYIIVGHCIIEKGPTDAILYRRLGQANGPIWCRPFEEFTDGRFTLDHQFSVDEDH